LNPEKGTPFGGDRHGCPLGNLAMTKRRNCHALQARDGRKRGSFWGQRPKNLSRMREILLCHCEERSDEVISTEGRYLKEIISFQLKPPAGEIATLVSLARNDSKLSDLRFYFWNLRLLWDPSTLLRITLFAKDSLMKFLTKFNFVRLFYRFASQDDSIHGKILALGKIIYINE